MAFKYLKEKIHKKNGNDGKEYEGLPDKYKRFKEFLFKKFNSNKCQKKAQRFPDIPVYNKENLY
jgi:hypothetical protein